MDAAYDMVGPATYRGTNRKNLHFDSWSYRLGGVSAMTRGLM
jgi:hypothetical protein